MYSAVDIVLLPDAAGSQLAIRLNESLRGPGSELLPLSSNGFLPHVSLAMAVVADAEIQALVSELQHLSTKLMATQLHARKLVMRKTQAGTINTSLDLLCTPALEAWHAKAMTLLPKQHPPAEAAMFAARQPVQNNAVAYVNSFRKQAAFKKYWPHITLGYGMPTKGFGPQHFTAGTLGLFKLGHSCTCHAEDAVATFQLVAS